MPIPSLNGLSSLGNLFGAGGTQSLLPGIGSGVGSPIMVANTPDGSNVETISIILPGTSGEIGYMDDGGIPPLFQFGGEAAGQQNVGEGFGGRSIECVDVDGPLDLGLHALFGLNQSDETESSTDIGDGFLTSNVFGGLAPSSLESAGATGPLGVDLDLLMQNGTGSALTSLVSVADGDLAFGHLLDGPGGRIDILTLQGPVEAILATGDGGDAGFPIDLGDDSLIGASLFDNLGNSNLEAFDIGLGSIGGLDAQGISGLDGLLDGLFS